MKTYLYEIVQQDFERCFLRIEISAENAKKLHLGEVEIKNIKDKVERLPMRNDAYAFNYHGKRIEILIFDKDILEKVKNNEVMEEDIGFCENCKQYNIITWFGPKEEGTNRPGIINCLCGIQTILN